MLVQTVGGLERDHFFSHRGITHSLPSLPLEAVAIATWGTLSWWKTCAGYHLKAMLWTRSKGVDD